MSGQLKPTQYAYSTAKQTADVLSNFDVWMNNTAVASNSGSAGGSSSGTSSAQDARKVIEQKMKDAAAGESDEGWSLMNTLLAGVDAIATSTGAWSSGDLAFSFTNTANPLAEVAYLGHSYLSMGLDLFATAGISSFLTAIPVVGKGVAFLSGAMVFVALIFITGGFTLAFLVPLLPFIWFFFNTLTWVLALMEGVVLMPLMALAHLNPEGDGLPGASAKGAYFLLLNIFLRPALMVFGLMCGLLLFFIAISFLNMMFTIAAAGTGASAGGFRTIAKLIFSVIYAGLAYICANHSFKAIGYFPEHALRWLGASGHHESMGTPEHMGAVMSGVAAIGGQQLGQQLQKPGQAVSQMIAARGQERKAEQKAAAGERVAGMRHQELIDAVSAGNKPPVTTIASGSSEAKDGTDKAQTPKSDFQSRLADAGHKLRGTQKPQRPPDG